VELKHHPHHPQCLYTSSDGKWKYDFTPLFLDNNVDVLSFHTDFQMFSNLHYFIQPCADYSWMLPQVCNGSSVCVSSDDQTQYSGGLYSTVIWSDGDNSSSSVTVSVSNGGECGTDGALRKTVIYLMCYEDIAMSQPLFNVVDGTDECETIVEIFSPAACPTNLPSDPRKMSGLHLALFALAIIAGCLIICVAFMVCCKGRRSRECQSSSSSCKSVYETVAPEAKVADQIELATKYSTQMMNIDQQDPQHPTSTFNSMFGLHQIPQPFFFVPNQQYYYTSPIASNDNQTE